jgi:hypothetical protein
VQGRAADFDDDEQQENEDAGSCQRFVLAMSVRMILVRRFP